MFFFDDLGVETERALLVEGVVASGAVPVRPEAGVFLPEVMGVSESSLLASRRGELASSCRRQRVVSGLAIVPSHAGLIVPRRAL